MSEVAQQSGAEAGVASESTERGNPFMVFDVNAPENIVSEFDSWANPFVHRDEEGVTGVEPYLERRLLGMRRSMDQEAEQIRVGGLTKEQIEGAEMRVRNNIIRLAHAAESGLLAHTESGVDEGTQAVLRHLSNFTIAPSTAPHLAPMVRALIEDGARFSDGDEMTSFEETYANARKQNVVAAVLIKRALSEASKEGAVDITDFNTRFYPESEAVAATPPAIDDDPDDKKKKEKQREKTEDREKMSAVAKEYRDLNQKVGKKLDAYFLRVEGDKNKSISPLDQQFLLSVAAGQVSLPLTAHQKALLGDVGIGLTEVQRMADLRHQALNADEVTRFMQNVWSVRDPNTLQQKLEDAERAVGPDLKQAYVDLMHKFHAELYKDKDSDGSEWQKYFEKAPHPNPQPGDPAEIWVFKRDVAARKAFQKKYIDEPMYKFFENIDRNTSSTYRDMFNIMTHGRYLELVTGMMNGLRRTLEDDVHLRLVDLDKYDTDHQRIQNSYDFTGTMLNYANSLQSYSQIFHDLPIFANDPASLEKWGGILAAIPATQQAMFLEDPLIEIARSVYERHLRSRIIFNDNHIPADILASQWKSKERIYNVPDIAKAKDELKRIAKSQDLEPEDWEISRAISYARGIGLLNLRDIEIIGSAKSSDHFRGIPDIVAKVWARHKWNLGRGGAGISLTPQIFGAMNIPRNPDDIGVAKNIWQRIARAAKGEYKHDPHAINELAKANLKALGEVLGTNFDLSDADTTFNEILNSFNLGSFYSRHGWRIEHLMGVDGSPGHEGILTRMREAGLVENLSWENNKKWGDTEWKKFYNIITLELGTGALWFYTGNIDNHGMMAGNRIQRYFNTLKDRQIIPRNLVWENAAFKDQGWEWKDYFEGKNAFKKLPIDVWLSGEDGYAEARQNLSTIHQWQVFQGRGEVLHRMMRRTPGDFILNAIQVAPELAKVYAEKGRNGTWSQDESNSVWSVNPDAMDAATKNRKAYLQNQFGEHGFKKLQELRGWVKHVERTFDGDPRFSVENNSEFDDPRDANGNRVEFKGLERRRKAIIQHVVNELAIGFEKLREIKEERNSEGFARGNEDLTMRPEHLTGDEIDPAVRDLIFDDQNGLFSKFDLCDHDFGGEDRINQHNFFFGLARAWTMTNRDAHIDTSDIDNYQIYQGIQGAGENVIKRLIGDLPHWNEVTEKLMGLDGMIEKIGLTGDLEDMYTLCHEIHDLRKIVGLENAEKAVFYIASTVATYMWEHEMTRIPGVSGTPWAFEIEKRLNADFGKGRRLSLSKIQFGKTAHTMDTKAIQEMFNTLGYDLAVLPEFGKHSLDHAKRNFDAREVESFFAEELPGGFMQWAILLLLIYMKKAMEENQNPN